LMGSDNFAILNQSIAPPQAGHRRTLSKMITATDGADDDSDVKTSTKRQLYNMPLMASMNELVQLPTPNQ